MAELLNLLFNLADAVKATNPVYDPRRPAQVVRTSPMGDAPDMSNWAYMDGAAASDPRTAGPMGTRINRPFPGYEIEWPNPRADANRLEGVGTGLPAGHNPDLLTAAVRKLFGTIPGVGPIGRTFVSDESPVTAPGLPRTPPTTDVATRPQPMSILDSIGAVASNSPAGTATGSLPDGLKSLFAPLMETMVRDAQMRNDPISRMGDVGLAMLDASGGGKPFAQSLAPLDAARQQATGGAMNMFLQVMGLDKQLEEMKAQERRFMASYELDKARLAETSKQHGETVRQGDERLGLERERLRVADAERRTKEANELLKRAEADHDTTRKTLGSATSDVIKFNNLLDTNPDYIKARKSQDWDAANRIAGSMAESVGKKTDLPADLRIRHVAYKNVADSSRALDTLLQTGPSVIDPTDRAEIKRIWSNMVLQYGIATGRGANFTEMEKALVTDVLGQSPTDLKYRSIESIKTFRERLGRFRGSLDGEIKNLEGASVRPDPRSESAPERGAAPQNFQDVVRKYNLRDTGRKMPDGRPIYVSPSGDEVSPPPRR